MGTKEHHQNNTGDAAAGAHTNTTATTATTTTTTPTQKSEEKQQQKQQNTTKNSSQEQHKSKTLPAQPTQQQQQATATPSTPTPAVLIIPATQASTLATNAAKKIRRAFSMPRNPFRWSRKFKTAAAAGASAGSAVLHDDDDDDGGHRGSNAAISSCVGSGRGRSGSIISLNSYEAVAASTDPKESSSNNNSHNNKRAATTNNNNNNSSAGNNHARVLRRSSFRKFLNRIAQHLSTTVNNVGANKHGQSQAMGAIGTNAGSERVPPIGGYQWPPDQTPGVMGLKNHGNTCFMNAVLQCLSHTDILAEYFVLDQYKADLKRRNKITSRKFGTKGELTEQLANVLKALWTCRNESDHSTSFKAVVDRYGTQFRSSTQHDAQEFLFWLLDKVHEDLNTASKRRYKSIKNSYGRSDEIIAAETLANHIRCNNSFVQAVFQAQFRSSLTCPRCKKQSNTFDPFHCISVQLPQLTQQTIFVTVVYMNQQPRLVKMGLRVPAGSPIVALREQLQTDTGIAASRMVLVDLNAEGFTRVFFDSQPVETLNSIESIYCIEVPEPKSNTPVASAAPTVTAEAKPASVVPSSSDLLLLVANVQRPKPAKEAASVPEEADKKTVAPVPVPALPVRFGAPFSMKAPRDCSFTELQKRILREMSPLLKPEVFSYSTPLSEMFRIRLQDPSADPDTYLEEVEHPLLTEMIDMALSVLSAEAGPQHIKLVVEWANPEEHFADMKRLEQVEVVEHESVARLIASKANDTAALTLEQCLEHYTKAETLSAEDAWRCPHCQQYLPVVKTLGLWSLPDILVVHFKRFRQHQAKGPQAAKLTTMVKFPLTAFDMSPHLARGLNDLNGVAGPSGPSNPWKKARLGDSRSSTLNSRCEQKDTRYDLYAVCYHQGDTLETGHYTAACKNPYDRQWYKFDDQRVSKVPEEAIEQDIINNEAYMLFYQRRSVDAGECSGSSSNSGDHWVSRIAPASATASTKEREAVKVDEVPVQPPAVAEPVEVISTEKVLPKPVDIPKVGCDAAEESSEMDLLEEIAFVDADVEVPEQPKETVATAEPLTSPMVDDCAQIFAMDEDCAPPSLGEDLSLSSPQSALLLPGEEIVVDQASPSPKMNGHAASPLSSKSSSSSSVTSLSSRSSPRSLSASTNAASTLQTKFNGQMNAAVATSTATSAAMPTALLNGNADAHATHNGNGLANGNAPAEISPSPKLSSSLKSHDLQLSRHALHNHCNRNHNQNNWHGSRSSVSAVENACQQHQASSASASLSLRHSFSTSSNYKLRECSETLSSLLRNSANTCSKDTLLFIDQQSHHHNHATGLIEDDDDTYMGRSLWISPVTPHKLITVSPKN